MQKKERIQVTGMQVAMASSGRHFVSFIDCLGIPELQP